MDISQIIPAPAISIGGTDSGAKTSKIASAASQFEALLIGEMLKSVREESDDGWLGGGADSSAESAFGIAESHLAQTIAGHGGFGLAKMIRHALDKSDGAPQSADGKQEPR